MDRKHDLLSLLIDTGRTPDDAQMECLRHEVNLLNSEMVVLQKRVKDIEILLNKYRRFTSTIQQIPFEILGQIFADALLEESMDREGRNMLVNFGLVCKDWRNASLLKHELWSRLWLAWTDLRGLACLEGVKTWWGRSGCWPRDLVLFEDEGGNACQGSDCPLFSSTMANLLSSGPDVQSLSFLDIDPGCLEHLLKSVPEWRKEDNKPSTWDNIKSLSIHFDDDLEWAWPNGDYGTLFSNLPPVTSLSLSLPDEDSAFDDGSGQSPLALKLPPVVLGNLLHLEWRSDWCSSYLLDTLDGCSNLTHLTIDCQNRFTLHNRQAWKSGIHLPRLIELRIQESPHSLRVLKLLTTPSLRTLDIGFGAGDSDVSGDSSDSSGAWEIARLSITFSQRLISFLKRRSNCVNNLRLLRLFRCRDPTDRIGSLLVQLPALQELILDSVEWDSGLWARLSKLSQCGGHTAGTGTSPTFLTHIQLLSRRVPNAYLQSFPDDRRMFDYIGLLQKSLPLRDGRPRQLTMSFIAEDDPGPDEFKEEDYLKMVRHGPSNQSMTVASLRNLGVSLAFLHGYKPLESWADKIWDW